MNFLAIDIGNTRYKALLTDDVQTNYFTAENEDSLIAQLKNIPLVDTYIICGTVSNRANQIYDFIKLKKNRGQIFFDYRTPVPLKNLYQTPETLGSDRIAGVVGASSLFPNTSCLIIGAGTAITYDIINNKNEYMGGSISLGLQIRYKALHQFTDNLPLLQLTHNNVVFPANNTNDCIHTGIVQGVVFEIENYIAQFEKQFPLGKTIISGGDSYYLVKKLKKHIFAKEELTLIGLINILKYNVL